MRSIEVDDEVYALLVKEARPLEDTANSVLRRKYGLDSETSDPADTNHRKSTLAPLVDAGQLSKGQRLMWRRRNLGEEHVAFVTEEGKMRLEDGSVHDSPSGACRAAAGISVNGWSAWCTDDGTALHVLKARI
ncbi:hypothetical protein ACFPM3_28460 [Streptomyces coeruleoprunus]|uniref:RAMA domain-containing protein n=1 Tax=Streptomyces coeruleoprunus TaxID=285563 RepID=A0ABV9XNM5_9ACTN